MSPAREPSLTPIDKVAPPVLPLQGVCADPGSDLPDRAPRWRWSWSPWGRTQRWNAQRRGTSRRLQLQTPQEEEKRLFPWKRDDLLRPRGSSACTVAARQFGNDAQSEHWSSRTFFNEAVNRSYIFGFFFSWLLVSSTFVLFRKAKVRPESVQGNPRQWSWLWWSTTQRSDTESFHSFKDWLRACVTVFIFSF